MIISSWIPSDIPDTPFCSPGCVDRATLSAMATVSYTDHAATRARVNYRDGESVFPEVMQNQASGRAGGAVVGPHQLMF
jgi:hypothetical protein